MKSRSLIFTIFILLLTACNQNDSFFIKSSSANGLSIGSGIYLDALQIGEIEDVMVSDKYKVVFKAGVKKGLEIPKNSKFKNVFNESLKERVIEIELGKDYEHLTYSDTVILIKNLHELVDSLVQTIKTNLFDKVKDKVNKNGKEN
ncbi:MCE family protein [Putridiphycobacter roseus]|nr:MCE family protein [Putridiphycobacter roseus]